MRPVGAQMVSMYQTNSVALRAERIISWAKARPSAVQGIANVQWGTSLVMRPEFFELRAALSVIISSRPRLPHHACLAYRTHLARLGLAYHAGRTASYWRR